MDETWQRTLSLSELLTRRKYRNVENLLTSQITYFHRKHGKFDFKSDIFDNPTATMAFRVMQFQINRSFIEDLCVAYVFDSKFGETDKKRKQIHSQILTNREYILKKYRLVEDLMDMPVEKNAKKYFTVMENWKGYQTYGDPESLLALHLSPYCSYQQFSDCLNVIEQKLKLAVRIHEAWQGLFNHLQMHAMSHFKELEETIKEKLVSET